MAFAFVIASAGAIIPNPLLPLYRTELGLSWMTLSVAFTINLVALIATLAWGSRTRHRGSPGTVLLVALAIGIGGDLVGVGSQISVGFLLASRVLSGVCLGLATGAAATLVVQAVGDRGRRLVAVGSLVGAAIGLGVATLAVELLPLPFTLVYVVHAGLTGLAVGLLLSARPQMELRARRCAPPLLRAATHDDRRTVRTSGAALDRWSPVGPARRRASSREVARGYVAGAFAWSAGGVLVGYLPSVAQETMGLTSQVATQASAFAFQIVAGVAGLVSVSISRNVGVIGLAAGCVVSAVAVRYSSTPVLLLGCAVAGFGQAVSYTTELGDLSGGVTAADQGVVSTRYSLVAYSASATFVLGAGALGSLIDPTVGLALVLGLIALGSVAMARRPA